MSLGGRERRKRIQQGRQRTLKNEQRRREKGFENRKE